LQAIPKSIIGKLKSIIDSSLLVTRSNCLKSNSVTIITSYSSYIVDTGNYALKAKIIVVPYNYTTTTLF